MLAKLIANGESCVSDWILKPWLLHDDIDFSQPYDLEGATHRKRASAHDQTLAEGLEHHDEIYVSQWKLSFNFKASFLTSPTTIQLVKQLLFKALVRNSLSILVRNSLRNQHHSCTPVNAKKTEFELAYHC